MDILTKLNINENILLNLKDFIRDSFLNINCFV